jgi:hypothetical protein
MVKYDGVGQRESEYKEDSTRGSSVINPLTYKGDVLIQVWIDSRILATLCDWLEKNGNYPRFMSEVVREPLRVMFETLTHGKDVDIVDDTNEARRRLTQRFRVDLSRGGRGGKNVLHNQILTDRRRELGERIKPEQKVPDIARPITSNKVTWIEIEDYPGYYYPEGDEGEKEKLISQLKAKGIKSESEKKQESYDMGKQFIKFANGGGQE